MAPITWWLFLGITFLLGILLQVYLLAAMAVMLAVVSLTAVWWRRRALVNVIYRRRLYYRRGFPGEEVGLQIEVENRKFLPVSWLRVEDLWPSAVGPQDESLLRPTHTSELGVLVNLFTLRWYERARRSYTLLLRRRGVFAMGPARLESGDIFGLFEKAEEVESPDYLTVFPEPLPFEALQLPAEDPFGDRSARRRLYEDPNQPMGVRNYRPEDDFRHIHWPATAHTSQLQVKVYQPASALVMVVCLNVSTLPHYWEGTIPGLLEHLVRVTAAIVQRGIQDGYRVGLISNGCLAHSDQPFRVPTGRSPRQLGQLFSALAGVTPFVTRPFERFLIAEVPRLPYGATLVIVTSILSPALAETVLKLSKHGRRISVLSVGRETPAFIPGVQIIQRPFSG